MQPGTRLHAVLQVGHQQRQAASTGAIGDLSASSKAAKGSNKAIPKTGTDTPSKAKTDKKPAPLTKQGAKKDVQSTSAAKPAAGKYLPAIQAEITKYKEDRAKDLNKVVAALDEVQKCWAKEAEVNKAEREEVARDADGIINSLASQLTTKTAEYDAIQAELKKLMDDKDAKDKSDEAAKAALAAEEMEHASKLKLLQDKLKDCEANAAAAKKELESKNASDLADMKAEMAKKAKEDKDMIEGLTAQIKVLTEKNGKCGDKEKAQIEQMQKESREAVEKYQKLIKEVCDKLAKFEVPSNTTEV